MTSLSNNKTTSATDYTYDGNGNLSIDKNKDITLIHYNFLNLPDSIVVTGKGNIKYTYDAAGNKLKKITTEGAKVTTTLYLYGNYVNDTLQFLPTEEGRVRFNVANSSLQYDYFIKDHLGNIRMVLTEQKDTSYYPDASLETSNLSNERLYYSKVDSGRVNKSTVTGYPNDTYTSPNDYIQKLNGNGVRVGTGIVLKVMAGDKFNLRVNSWWNSNNSPGTPVNPLNDLLSALNGGVSSVSSGHYTSTDLSSNSALNPGATDFLNSHTGYSGSIPKAFINWVLFDEQFKFVSSSSGFEQVGSSNTFTTHTRTNVAINKSGYLYVYVSNETPNIDVYFDNLQVTHIRGNLISDESFYPFGLKMSGISDKSLNFGAPENHFKFNDKEEQRQEFSDGSGLEWYDYKNRFYDDQIGRFFCVDLLADKYPYYSPYQFAGNEVPNAVDLDGLEPGRSPQGVLATIPRQQVSESTCIGCAARNQRIAIANTPPVPPKSQSASQTTVSATDTSPWAEQRRAEFRKEAAQAKVYADAYAADPTAAQAGMGLAVTMKATAEIPFNTAEHGVGLFNGIKDGDAKQIFSNTFLLALDVSPFLVKGPTSGIASEAGQALNTVDRSASVLGHIFRDEVGHVNPGTLTSQNRFINLFENVANNANNLRADAVSAGLMPQAAADAGVQVYTQTFKNGQVWVFIKDGKVTNAGINLTAK
ncbi:MAG: hypothetical protein JST17_05015 [Bacteroidetes bacterium]|nr:hypothetical protein [Bacteroidota bacterium]